MKKGIKSSEFYVVLLIAGAWAIKYLGLDVYLTPENINEVAEAIKQSHNQGIDPAGYVGAIYVAGRVLLKWKAKDEFIQQEATNGNS